MICPSCRTPIAGTGASCPRCGRRAGRPSPREQKLAIVSLILGIAALLWSVLVVLTLGWEATTTAPRYYPSVTVLVGWVALLPAMLLGIPAMICGAVALYRHRASPSTLGSGRAAVASMLCAALSGVLVVILPAVILGTNSISHRLSQASEEREQERERVRARESTCAGIMEVLAGTPNDLGALNRRLRRLRGNRPPASCLCDALGRAAPVVVQWMIDHGADTRSADCAGGYTPLGVAVALGSTDATARLLAGGADPNEGGIDQPPLHVATSRSQLAVMKLLLSKGGSPDVRSRKSDECGWTTLHAAMSFPGPYAVREQDSRDRVAAIEMLLDAGASPTAADCQGDTPLHRAAYSSFPEGAEVVLRRCAALHCSPAPLVAKNRRGATPLDVAREIQVHGADPQLAPRRDRMVAALQTWSRDAR